MSIVFCLILLHFNKFHHFPVLFFLFLFYPPHKFQNYLFIFNLLFIYFFLFVVSY
ncbi:hypothetical protein C1645_795252 [Glomus cerebriforme]|uniref:Uncharacterized protein n=1 Tax=Glomus cerebriforme TaxID=658196 RepID=A0A397RYV4_9GLOM|nr:hypothetical protein C1645_795252 [Glomus cerebriforme]